MFHHPGSPISHITEGGDGDGGFGISAETDVPRWVCGVGLAADVGSALRREAS